MGADLNICNGSAIHSSQPGTQRVGVPAHAGFPPDKPINMVQRAPRPMMQLGQKRRTFFFFLRLNIRIRQRECSDAAFSPRSTGPVQPGGACRRLSRSATVSDYRTSASTLHEHKHGQADFFGDCDLVTGTFLLCQRFFRTIVI